MLTFDAKSEQTPRFAKKSINAIMIYLLSESGNG
jgi:hypothetical protein